jgi:hypothetical protein
LRFGLVKASATPAISNPAKSWSWRRVFAIVTEAARKNNLPL